MLHRLLFFAATTVLLALNTHLAQAQDVCTLCAAKPSIQVSANAADTTVQKIWAGYYNGLRDSFSGNRTVIKVLNLIQQADTLPLNQKNLKGLENLTYSIVDTLRRSDYKPAGLIAEFQGLPRLWDAKDSLRTYYAQKYALACAFACFAHQAYTARPDHPDIPEAQRAQYRKKLPPEPSPFDFSRLLAAGMITALICCLYLLYWQRKAEARIKDLEERLSPKPEVVVPPSPSPPVIPPPSPHPPGSKENPLPAVDEKNTDTKKIQWVDDSPASTKPSTQSLTLYASHPNAGIFYSVSPQFDHNLYMFRIVLSSPDTKEAELLLMDDSDVLRRTFSDLHTNLQAVAELYGVGQPSASIPYTVKPGRVVRYGENWQLKSKMELSW